MPSRVKILLAISALLITTLACSRILGEGLPETKIPESIVTDVPLTEEEPALEISRACPLIMDQIMKKAASGGDGAEENLLDKEVYLVSYIVSGDEISDPAFEAVGTDLQDEQNDFATHQQVWEYFSALIPADQRETVAVFSIVTDGRGGNLAAVSQIQANANRWDLQVDIADLGNTYDLTFTLLHEFGHLLTLGPDQVPPSDAVFNNPENNDIYLQEVSACPNYFPGEGCANPDSYINAFYSQFWTDIHDEWNEINLEEDEDSRNEKLDSFYLKYQDRFVTGYAATSPEEDIAESWSFFVLGPEPSGDTIADEKILFFHQYPELVELRANILSNLCAVFP